MIESVTTIAIGLLLLAVGLLNTFPQINSWKKLFFWMGVVILSIPAYLILSLMIR